MEYKAIIALISRKKIKLVICLLLFVLWGIVFTLEYCDIENNIMEQLRSIFRPTIAEQLNKRTDSLSPIYHKKGKIKKTVTVTTAEGEKTYIYAPFDNNNLTNDIFHRKIYSIMILENSIPVDSIYNELKIKVHNKVRDISLLYVNNELQDTLVYGKLQNITSTDIIASCSIGISNERTFLLYARCNVLSIISSCMISLILLVLITICIGVILLSKHKAAHIALTDENLNATYQLTDTLCFNAYQGTLYNMNETDAPIILTNHCAGILKSFILAEGHCRTLEELKTEVWKDKKIKLGSIRPRIKKINDALHHFNTEIEVKNIRRETYQLTIPDKKRPL